MGAGLTFHLLLGLRKKHFERWLFLWQANCRDQLPIDAGSEMNDLFHHIARKLRKILDFPKGILRLSGDTGAFEQFFGLLDDILHPSRLSRWFRMPPAGRLQRKPNRPKDQVAL